MLSCVAKLALPCQVARLLGDALLRQDDKVRTKISPRDNRHLSRATNKTTIILNYWSLRDKTVVDNTKALNLRNLDIVLINYVEESKKDELLKELKQLYGEYEPVNGEVPTSV